jgi:F-type H+-transporting ATPase subunit a
MAHDPNPWHEVQDTTLWNLFENTKHLAVSWELPVLIKKEWLGLEKDIYLTKFMVLEVVAAVLVFLIYWRLARRIKSGELPKGRWWNFFETLLVFVRDDIARPSLGGHHHTEEADRFLPFLWTLFLFILFCNLLGMIPGLGSPTASIWTTVALALCSLVVLHGAAILKHGPIRYLKSLWPHIDVPYVGWIFSLLIFTIEFLGTFIKSAVLAIRLFANMLAGHLVLANIMLFIFVAGKEGLTALWGGVTVATLLMALAISLLELFIAFLQAYVFTFLTALFIGMGLNPEH